MSAPPGNFGANAGKKAVHVKWAGKTIALGTFPASEADEKCARAKALTRAWRSTMRPKPSRDWVMLELERLGVRVVSGRLGRKAGEEGDEGGVPPQGGGEKKPGQLGGGGMPGAPGQDLGVPMNRNGSLGWGADGELSGLMGRRSSSLGLAGMMNDRRGSLSSLGVVGLDAGDAMPPHRPMVGGGAAAAYEAARHDHFSNKNPEQARRTSSLGLGLAGGGIGSMGVSVNPNQHYEMLKLHHMNLLNEIQETTLMMNLYQQQQLQQQQQQLQQQQQATGSDHLANTNGDQVSMMMQQSQAQGGNMEAMFNGQMGQGQRNASLGLGSMGPGGGYNPQMPMMDQRTQQQASMMQGGGQPGALTAMSGTNAPQQPQSQPEQNSGDIERARMMQLKEEIAARRNANESGQGAQSNEELGSDNKRPTDGGMNEQMSKRPKVEETGEHTAGGGEGGDGK